MSPTILTELGAILEQLDNAEEVVCAAQLQLVIDTLEMRLSAQDKAAAALNRAAQPRGDGRGLSQPSPALHRSAQP